MTTETGAICGHCNLPIHQGDAVRHFDTHVAHKEHRCLDLLKAKLAETQTEADRRTREVEACFTVQRDLKTQLAEAKRQAKWILYTTHQGRAAPSSFYGPFQSEIAAEQWWEAYCENNPDFSHDDYKIVPILAALELPREHCQNGGDVCLAGSQDGVCCPEESCDIDDGMRVDAVLGRTK